MSYSSSRTTQIPIGHIEAEVAAFPLASEESFNLCTTTLNPRISGNTGELWRAAENYILRSTPSLSVDEVLAIRDKRWFSSDNDKIERNNSIKLSKFMERLSSSYLQRRGRFAVPIKNSEQDDELDLFPDESRWAWRWMSFALPLDIFLVSLARGGEIPCSVDQMSPNLTTMLKDGGFVEPHLHINAGLDFRHAWSSLSFSIANSREVGQNLFRSPGAVFNDGSDFGRWLIRAFIIRYGLALFLQNRQQGDNLMGFWCESLKPIFEYIYDFAFYLSKIYRSIDELCNGKLLTTQNDYSLLQNFYSTLTGASLKSSDVDIENFHSLDPLSDIFRNWKEYGITPEMCFISSGFKYIEERAKRKEKDDELFECLFWQVQRLKVLFYRHVTQRPMTPGLLWFIRFYGRIKPARLPRMKSRICSAARLDGLNNGLSCFEIRTAPDDNLKDMKDSLNDIIDGFQEINRLSFGQYSESPVECAVVYHFPKSRSRGSNRGIYEPGWANTHAEPGLSSNENEPYKLYRYSYLYNGYKRSAITLGRLILDNPHVLKIVRGIDICNDELSVPTWVFVPIFRYLRDVSHMAGMTVSKTYPPTSLHLRTTVHCGEDFVHLATGLRKIYELYRFLDLREGDRIGHGMALGVDPFGWASRAGSFLMTREGRLFDLIWEYLMFVENSVAISNERSLYLRHNILKLGREIFKDDKLGVEDFVDVYCRLHDEGRFKNIGYPDNDFEVSKENKLLKCYLNDRGVFERGHELVRVSPIKDVPSLVVLQRQVKSELSRLGVTVEVNPSSNLLIGHLGDFKDHPLWRIMPVDETLEEPTVSVCVGSDDPLTFNTNVRLEYQYLADSAARAGFTEEQISRWLEKARQNGLASRFSVPYEPIPVSYSEEVYVRVYSEPVSMP